MSYRKLIAEHDAIEAAALVVVTIVESDRPSPTAASKAVEVLAQLLRDHLAGEDTAIYQTVLAARGSRHAGIADRMGVELDALKDDWIGYLYKWDAEGISSDWTGFVRESQDMLGRIRERVAFETMILYSLALHLDVITAE